MLEAGAEDVNIEEDVFEVYTQPGDFPVVRKALEEKGLSLISAGVDWIPQNTITLDGENLVKFTRMLDGLEDNDDVQRVFHNVDLPEEEEEE